MNTRPSAFTLIELLIVVAIIAILAAIAVPNFLEAQTRAKVARVKSDQRTLATALESYAVDYNAFPPTEPVGVYQRLYIEYVKKLSTPVAYVTTVALKDPFQPNSATAPQDQAAVPPPDWKGSYPYVNYNDFWQRAVHPDDPPKKAFIIISMGPTRMWPYAEHYPYMKNVNPNFNGARPTWPDSYSSMIYDPSNGTVSFGGIVRFGGDLAGIEQVPGG